MILPEPFSADTCRIEPPEAEGVQHITCGFNTLSRCRHGWMLYNGGAPYVGSSLYKYGEYSEGEVDIFDQLLRPGNVVVEAGANVGAHTIPIARMVGAQGAVFAIEPQRIMYQVLTANAALNALSNIITVHAAVGDQPGTIRVPVLDPARQAQNFGSVSLLDRPENSDGEEVSLLTIDGMNLPACRLIKADVEGMEHEVLQGARDTIARLRPALYVENDRSEQSPRVIALIQSLGYRLWWHATLLYNPANYRGDPENIFGNTISLNILCLPPEQAGAIQLPEIHSPQDQ